MFPSTGRILPLVRVLLWVSPQPLLTSLQGGCILSDRLVWEVAETMRLSLSLLLGDVLPAEFLSVDRLWTKKQALR